MVCVIIGAFAYEVNTPRQLDAVEGLLVCQRSDRVCNLVFRARLPFVTSNGSHSPNTFVWLSFATYPTSQFVGLFAIIALLYNHHGQYSFYSFTLYPFKVAECLNPEKNERCKFSYCFVRLGSVATLCPFLCTFCLALLGNAKSCHMGTDAHKEAETSKHLTWLTALYLQWNVLQVSVRIAAATFLFLKAKTSQMS